MIFHIAGINHFDPLCRVKLREWLGQCSRSQDRPRFLATEFNEEVFRQIEAQRKAFRRLLRDQWPRISADLTNTLTLSLAYEGDTHLEIFPNVEILWLDQDRRLNAVEIEGISRYAKDRLNMYRGFLGHGPLPGDDKTLATISEAAARVAGVPRVGGDERDRAFARLINQRIGNQEGWAIIIVGKNHAIDADGSMRCLLENAGHPCEVTLL